MSNSNNGMLKSLWPAVLRQTKLLCFDFGKACFLLRSQQICASGWKSGFLNRCQYAGSVRSKNHIRFFLCSLRWGEGRSPARPGSWGWQCIAGRGSLGADSIWTSKIVCCLEAIFFSGLHAAAGKIVIKHASNWIKISCLWSEGRDLSFLWDDSLSARKVRRVNIASHSILSPIQASKLYIPNFRYLFAA
jgi:hypothetical protein